MSSDVLLFFSHFITFFASSLLKSFIVLLLKTDVVMFGYILVCVLHFRQHLQLSVMAEMWLKVLFFSDLDISSVLVSILWGYRNFSFSAHFKTLSMLFGFLNLLLNFPKILASLTSSFCTFIVLSFV